MPQAVQNYINVQNRIRTACKTAGRDFKEVTLLPVIKYADNKDILALLTFLGAGALAAESRLQDARKRWSLPEFAALRGNVRLHYIGRLQKNKIAGITAFFDFIDSLPDFETAALVNEEAAKINKTARCLVQVKLTDAPTQGGVTPDNAARLIQDVKNLKNINLCGLMAIAPQEDRPELLRPAFKTVKKLFDEFFADRAEKYLSLGMSGDFEIAVEEGSTLPRVGSDIFRRTDDY